MIPRSGDGDVVEPRLGVERGRGQKAGGRNTDGARLAVAVLAGTVGGAAVGVNLAEVGAANHLQSIWRPADGPAVVGHRAVAPPGEARAGADRHTVGSGSSLIPRSGDGDVVVPRLGVERGRGQNAGGRNTDGARLAVAVRAGTVGGAAVGVNLAEGGAAQNAEPCGAGQAAVQSTESMW